MNSSRNHKIFSILSLVVAVIAVSFAYASLTHTLKIAIASPGKEANESWAINFNNLSKGKKTGTAEENSSPIIESSTTVANFDVTFYSPGDSVTYFFDVENNGTLDAAVSSIQITSPICAGETNDCINARKNVKFELTYADGSSIRTGDMLYAKKNNYIGSSNKKLKLTITYSKNTKPNEVPKNSVKLTGYKAVILYEQGYLG